MTSPSDNRPSLTDPQVVEKVLISLAREAVGCRIASAKGIIREEDANTIEEKEIENRARIFLNRDKAYAADAAWNKPGVIDAFLMRSLSIDLRGAEPIVKAALGSFLTGIRERLNISENPDISEAEWKKQIEDIVALYRDIFMGTARSRVPAPGTTVVKKQPEPPEKPMENVRDPQIVEKILVALARESLNAHRAVVSNFITIQDAAVIEEKEIESRARVFLGRDKNYAIDPNWNKPGVLDRFLADYLNINVRGAEEIIKDALGKFLVEVRQHFDVSQHPNFTEAEWKSKVAVDIDKYRDLFLGKEPAPAAAETAAPQMDVSLLAGAELDTEPLFERRDDSAPTAANPPASEPVAAPVPPEAPAPAPAPAPTPVVPALPTPPKVETVFVTKPFLGDPQAVAKILGALAKEAIGCRIAVAKQIITEQDARRIEEGEAENRARIFLGRDKNYAVDATWSMPGAIDVFVAKQLGIESKGPEEILKSALLKFIEDAQRKAGLATEPNVAEDVWKKRIEAVVERYSNLLVGLLPEPETVFTAAPPREPAPVPLAPVAEPVKEIAKPEPPKEPVVVEPPKAPKPVVKAETRPKPKKEEPVAAPREMAAMAEATGLEEAGSKKGGGGWRWAALFMIALIVGLVSYLKTTREVPLPPKPVAETPKPKPQKPAAPKIYALHNGVLVTLEKGADGKTIIREVKSQSARKPSGASAKAQGEIAQGGQERKITRPLEFWYDLNSASGVACFLVATERDATFPVEFDVSEAWDLWLTDEYGNEKFISPSVFRARFSPDGKKIAYTTSDCILHVIDLDLKELAQTDRAYEPNWNRDGSVILFERVFDGRRVYPAEALQLARFDWQSNKVEAVVDGGFDDLVPHFHPSGEWVLFVSGNRTGGASFWKVLAGGGSPVQLTNMRFGEGGAGFVPTPYQTALWSADGHWFVFDYKLDTHEQTWGLEFDDKGNLKRAVKLADGLSPQWTGPTTFVSQKRVGDGFELVAEQLPGS